MPQLPLRNAPRAKNLTHLVGPEEPCDSRRVYAAVASRPTQNPEPDAPPLPAGAENEAPPFRYEFLNGGDVSFHYDRSRVVEDGIVDGNLPFQPAQRVTVTLDLVSDEIPVHHCDVGAASAVLEAELVNDERVLVAVVTVQHCSVESLSDSSVFEYHTVPLSAKQ